jgi:hypothetical protein
MFVDLLVYDLEAKEYLQLQHLEELAKLKRWLSIPQNLTLLF